MKSFCLEFFEIKLDTSAAACTSRMSDKKLHPDSSQVSARGGIAWYAGNRGIAWYAGIHPALRKRAGCMLLLTNYVCQSCGQNSSWQLMSKIFFEPTYYLAAFAFWFEAFYSGF